MKAVIQRVTKASVSIDGGDKREIGRGMAVLLGVTGTDTEEDEADYQRGGGINQRGNT